MRGPGSGVTTDWRDMDPEFAATSLNEILEAQKTRPLTSDEVAEAAELAAALNDWLERKGFPPLAWTDAAN